MNSFKFKGSQTHANLAVGGGLTNAPIPIESNRIVETKEMSASKSVNNRCVF